jgi:hypothetical protein
MLIALPRLLLLLNLRRLRLLLTLLVTLLPAAPTLLDRAIVLLPLLLVL